LQLGEAVFWTLSLLLYIVGDLTLTFLSISAGKIEFNPVGLSGVLFFKLIAVLIGIIIYHRWKSLIVPATFALLGVIAIVSGLLI